MRPVVIFSLFLSASVAQAAPLTWVFDDVQFEDGTYITGSFDFDADTVTYSNVAITTRAADTGYFDYTQWGEPATHTYSPTLGKEDRLGGEFYVIDVENNIDYFLAFLFDEDLTNAGGTIGVWGYEDHHDRTGGILVSEHRYVASGTVRSVPIPAAIWLFGSALAGLGWMRGKQTA